MLITEDEIRKYVSANVSSSIEALEPHLTEAEENYVVDVLGAAEYNKLHAAYIAEPQNLTAPQTAILPLCQDALANLGYYLYAPTGNVQISDQGIHMVGSGDRKSAFPWMVKNLRDRLQDKGLKAVEKLLAKLWASPADYTDWAASDNKRAYRAYFINTTKEFEENGLYSIRESAAVFWDLKPSMAWVEREKIRPILGKALYVDIKDEIASLSISSANADLLEFIQPAVARLSVIQAIINQSITLDRLGVTERSISEFSSMEASNPARNEVVYAALSNAQQQATEYLGELRKFLNDNYADYPLYDYTAPESDTPLNSPENSGFWA